MSKRHYTCRRSGDDLLVVEADEGEIVRRGIAVAVGAVLLWEGARRSGLWAALGVAAGAELCAGGHSAIRWLDCLLQEKKRPVRPILCRAVFNNHKEIVMSNSNDRVADVGNEAGNLSADMEALKKSFAQLRTDLSSLVQSAVGVGKHGAGAVKDQAANAVDGLKHRMTDLKEKGAESCDAFEQTISEHPLSSALVALGIGFILAKLLTRK